MDVGGRTQPPPRAWHRPTLLLTLLWLTAGCFGLGSPTPQAIHTYDLTYEAPLETSNAVLPVVVQMAPLHIAAAYDHEAIAYRDNDHRGGTYFYHRWAAPPAKLVGDRLARDLAHARQYRAVLLGISPLPADILLSGDIEAIGEIPSQAGCAAELRLRVVAAHLAGRGDAVLWQASYGGEEPCACNDPDSLVPAMSRLLQRLSQQLQHDLYDALARRGTP